MQWEIYTVEPFGTPGEQKMDYEKPEYFLFNGSVGRTDLPGGDHAALIRSITEKLLPLGDDIAFICGHGPGSTFGQERVSNPFLNGGLG